MTDMRDFDSKPTKLGFIVQVVIWAGVLLLLVGSLLAYPYVHSRLTVLSPTPTRPPAPLLSMVTSTVASAAPTSSFTPTSSYTSTFTSPLAPTHTPTLTPIPALPTRVVIPVIGVDAPIVPVSWQTLEVAGQAQAVWEVPDMYAAGWHETSAPPGIPGNTVLNGHNTTHGEVFRDLYTLEEDDVIIIYTDNAIHTYAAAKVLILPEAGQPLEVRQRNARYILPTDDERLTLVTCHPYGSLRNRLIVIAHPVTADSEG
jgi:LPXTG-site transpeptidase (sortase) family protein